MAETFGTDDPIPPPPMSRPNAGLLAWAIFGLAVAGLLAYGFVASRGPSLRSSAEGIVLEGTPGSVRTYGSIPAVLGGDTAGKINLSVLPSGPGVVGVGSLSDLRGEIAIVRGLRWLSYPAGNGMKLERTASSGESAAFLALADVSRWQEQRFDAAVPFERLAAELEQRAKNGGLDTARPFPLVIDGRLSAIELSVANGPAPSAALSSTVSSAEGSVVGFFAASGGERLLHPGQRLHLHVVLPGVQQVGHLDSVRIEPGALLRLPATR